MQQSPDLLNELRQALMEAKLKVAKAERADAIAAGLRENEVTRANAIKAEARITQQPGEVTTNNGGTICSQLPAPPWRLSSITNYLTAIFTIGSSTRTEPRTPWSR